MEEDTLHERYLIVIALLLCAVIIGYNAFYVPDASLSAISVKTDSSASKPSEPPGSSAVSAEEYTPNPPASASAAESSKAAQPVFSGKININTASAQQMNDALDGIGAVMAQRIVNYREQHGKFKSVSELKNVDGIGEKTFAKIQNSVTVD